MQLQNKSATWFIPDGTPVREALARVTHLGIGAHQDDLEFMAFHGILAGYQHADQWFGGVTCTDGGGSARGGAFAAYTDEQMRTVRREEQNRAAEIGRYGVMLQLDYPSAALKQRDPNPVQDLKAILEATRPEIVYTHNPADKHETHIAVLAATLTALRALPQAQRPAKVYGCEVWRGLDWMLDEDRVPLDVGGNMELAQALNGVFASQIEGGKRYDRATPGRRFANATFSESHRVDPTDQVWFAMDLTPLIEDDHASPLPYVQRFIDRFNRDVTTRLATYFPPPQASSVDAKTMAPPV